MEQLSKQFFNYLVPKGGHIKQQQQKTLLLSLHHSPKLDVNTLKLNSMNSLII